MLIFFLLVSMVRPQLVVISPRGDQIAYVVQRGHIESNRNRDEFFIWKRGDKETRRAYDADKILQVAWGDEDSVYLLTKEKDKYHLVLGRQEGFFLF